MDNNILNFDVLHTFFKGMRTDLDNHAESDKSYIDAANGRLFSKDGVLSYSSLDGTVKVYENNNIVKYTGFCAFKDELILFTKCEPDTQDQEQTCTDIMNLITFPIDIDGDDIPDNVFEIAYQQTMITVCVPSIPVDENDFETPISCVGSENDITDFGDLFIEIPVLPLQYCPVFNNDVPVNNLQYKDGIWSMTYNDQGMLTARLIWFGNLNIAMDAKICTVGVDENNFYKRVYFTDSENEYRVINLKDGKLRYRQADELNIHAKGTLLNPRIVQVRNNGVLAAMSVCYVYRLITENGQLSDFSATSRMVKINKDDGDYQFSGGGISETTNKSVLVSCTVPQFQNFSEIELVAIEFEANLVPTSIRTVGRQSVGFYNEFEHFGNESEFTENVTLADIFANSISWKYNSDIATENNKIIAVGLRNDPSFVNSQNIDIDFALHGFHWEEGETHGCLLNPNPVRYNYIDVAMNEPFMFVSKKIFRKITILGSFWVRLQNKTTGEFYQLNVGNGVNYYKDYTETILSFLLNIEEDEADFATNFPNLTIGQSEGKILFLPIDANAGTDMYNYELIFSTPQVIIDSSNALQLRNFSWPSNAAQRNARLVYGGVSNGFFNGNGVRVSVQKKSDHVMDKNTDWHDGSGPILQIKEPTLLKGCMKGEIYRIGIQWYKNGQRLFVTILGDLKIPDIGQVVREIQDDGSVFVGPVGPGQYYQNMTVEGNQMFAHRLELKFEVKISCELSRQVDAYQIVYVERTEENRSILAQGLMAPLHRMLEFSNIDNNTNNFDDRLTDKWNIPYYGGPIIEKVAFENYDENPNNDDPEIDGSNYNWQHRIYANRKLCYFDSPDLIYGRISDKNIDSAILQYLNTVRTDHDIHNIVAGYNRDTTNNDGTGTEILFENGDSSRGNVTAPFGSPKFSTKIPFNDMGLIEQTKPYFVNVSVFANILKSKRYLPFTDENSIAYIGISSENANFDIDKAQNANEGQQVGGYKFGEAFDLVNAAAALGSQGWWYQRASRIGHSAEFSSFRINNIAMGRHTLFLKTEENLFTDNTIAQNEFIIKCIRSFGTNDHNAYGDCVRGYDSHIIANIKRDNVESIYGGRTEYAYSKNEYIAMSDVMPVITNNVSIQKFNVQGDVYCVPFIRNKTSYRDAAVPVKKDFNYRDGKEAYTRYGAWCYAVVLETMVEPRLNYSEEFYRQESGIGFNMDESHNPAYFQIADLRKSIPKPLGFKDDPNQLNVIAVSDTKLSGDYYDAFTRFRTNEFYELPKEKGAALNVVVENSKVYVVQELQTNHIYFDERSFITPDDGGSAIQVNQGNGSSVSGHEAITPYGTSIRRAIVENPLFGFCFMDERKKEFIKINNPLFLENELSIFMNNFFTENEIIDTEGYYDEVYKETNIRVRTKTGLNFILSYNEVLKCFNGRIEMDNDIYPVFQETVLAPYANSHKLGQLNTGNVLSFFEAPKKDMMLQFISAPDSKRTQILKGIAVNVNTNYPIYSVTFETSLGQIREVLGTHHWYKIREGIHSIPSLNPEDEENIRGEWGKITLVIKSQDNKKIDIFSVINYLRNSYK